MDGAAFLTIPGGRRPVEADDRRRFFIVNAGRTGSTLLSAILADCGAEFGMEVPESWDAGSGDLEHPELWRASRWFRRAYDISATRPALGPRRCAWNACRSIGKRKLGRLLRAARYLKGENLDLLVQPGFKLGYFPSIILSYRRFEDHAVSSLLKSAQANLEALVGYYNRVNRNGLLLLSTFGGCVVGFDRLGDRDDVSWVEPLAGLTGFSPERLRRARERRLGALSRPVATASLDRSAAESFATIEALAGRLIEPSAQAVRSSHAIAVHAAAPGWAVADWREIRDGGGP